MSDYMDVSSHLRTEIADFASERNAKLVAALEASIDV